MHSRCATLTDDVRETQRNSNRRQRCVGLQKHMHRMRDGGWTLRGLLRSTDARLDLRRLCFLLHLVCLRFIHQLLLHLLRILGLFARLLHCFRLEDAPHALHDAIQRGLQVDLGVGASGSGLGRCGHDGMH